MATPQTASHAAPHTPSVPAAPSAPTIELGVLLRQYELDLVLITDAEPTLPVQAVHSSDMRDPTPFLTPRTVLLTTGTQFGDEVSNAAADAYILRLREAGVTALGIGIGIVWDRIPHPLIAAAERHGLPLFRVAYQTPFLAIAQVATRLLNAQVHARDAWSLESQRSVALAATQRDGLSAVVREAAGRLGRWVAITDRTGALVEVSPRNAFSVAFETKIGAEARALVERGTRSSRVRAIDERPIELQTLGRSDRLLGTLVSPVGIGDQAERMLLALVAAIATVQLEHRAGRGEAETALRTAVLTLLLEGEADLALRIAAGVLPRLPQGRVSVIRLGAARELPESLIGDLRSLASTAGLLTAPLEGRSVLVCESAQLPAVRKLLSAHAVRAGVSTRGPIERLSHLLDEAVIAFGHADSRSMTDPVEYRPDMHGGLLRLLDAQPEAHRLAEGLLAPLRQHDARHDDHIEQSLAVWLQHHGQMSPAATELGVHRHTLRHRVQTAESLLHRDLGDPDTRAELWAALRYRAANGSQPAAAQG